MAVPEPLRVPSDAVLPNEVDVAIIGGGIVGLCSALELCERGLRTAVFEKGIVAGEQSGRNWGWCRQMGRDPRELPLIQISMQRWREMRQRVGGETGFRECGIAYLCDTDEKLAKRQSWHDSYVGAHGLTSRMIGAHEAQAMTPNCTVQWKGGLYTPNDGRAEPQLAAPAIARSVRSKGVQIFQHCAVRGFETQAGRISGIVTEKGALACQSVVLAGGAWSRRFCHNMGIRLPQLTVVNSVMRSAPLEAGVEQSLAAQKFAIRKRLDGGYTIAHAIYNSADLLPDSFRLAGDFIPLLKNEWRDFRYRLGSRFFEEARLKRRWSMDETSPFETVRRLDPQPVASVQNEALASLQAALPAFKDVTIQDYWAGAIDVVPDAVPIISAVDAVPGFYLATGFSGHGFGLAPGAGQLMAEIITGQAPCVDPEPFRFDRF